MYLLDPHTINVRLDICQNHCQEDQYKKGLFRNYCGVCNCTISDKQSPFNKLAHPCQGCPLNYWSKFAGCEQGCSDCETE